jgi:hypothetical protein
MLTLRSKQHRDLVAVVEELAGGEQAVGAEEVGEGLVHHRPGMSFPDLQVDLVEEESLY